MHAIEQAHAELQAEMEELRFVHRDVFEDDTDDFSDLDDLEESFYDE